LNGSDPSRDFYKYYAGYSEAFVADALAALELDPKSIILDPWNGAGTTTSLASQLGHYACGVDLNPALVVIARARSIVPSQALSILNLLSGCFGGGF
jgi:DNA modification methylase